MQYFLLNDLGKPIEVLEDNKEKNPMIVEGWDGSFYSPMYDFNLKQWYEGMSQEEINQIQNQPQSPSDIELIKIETEMNALAIMELAEIILGG